MSKQPGLFQSKPIRDDFVPKEGYIDRDFAELEAARLWPYVWQVACRLEEIPNVGDYVTYDIIDDSIIVVRTTPDEIRAYHNFCPHRGTQLTEGCGHLNRFVCPFHGWRFGLDGKNEKVIDPQDWGDKLKPEDIALKQVKCDTWAGFIFINMDPDCQPLEEFLKPVNARCDRFEIEKQRYAWYKTTIVPANWKTVLEAFNEFYHVQHTHHQMLTYTNDYSVSDVFGRHAMMRYSADAGLPVGRSPRLPPKEEPDFRNYLFEYAEQFKDNLRAMQTNRAYEATLKLKEAVPADAKPEEVLAKWGQLVYEAAQEAGSGWPENLTPEYIAESGFDWHVFPNTIFLHGAVEAVLWYRARPNGRDHTSTIFDVFSLERFAPGTEPPLNREFSEDWRDGDWPLIFRQDFKNIPRVQRGMQSRGFTGSRTNPIQEKAIPHFNRILRTFLEDPHADDGVA